MGGTVSVATGGKFANGAITGAFSRLLNDNASNREGHRQRLREKALEFKKIIEDALDAIGLANDEAAVKLLLATAIQESGLKYRFQFGNGPGRGLFQMEIDTHNDIWENYLKYRPELAAKVKSLLDPSMSQIDNLTFNDKYAAAMARIHYLRVPKPISEVGNISQLANYWKMYYNTANGGGTVRQFQDNWCWFMGECVSD